MHMEHLFAYIVGADVCCQTKCLKDYKFKEKYQHQSYNDSDSTYDIETGNNFKDSYNLVTWCKTTKNNFLEAKATRIIDSPKELP